MRLNKIVKLGLYLLLMGIMALPLFGLRAPNCSRPFGCGRT